MHQRGVGAGVADELGVGVTDGSGEGVAVGCGVGVAVASGVGAAVGSGAGVTVVVGDVFAVAVGTSHTTSIGFIWFELSMLPIAGAVNAGASEPPPIKATVPVRETNTTFEFDAFALAAVHGIVQNIVGVLTAVSAPQAPEEALPRLSNRITIGYVSGGSATMEIMSWELNLIVRVSMSGSSAPFWFASVSSVNDVALVISTRDIFSQ